MRRSWSPLLFAAVSLACAAGTASASSKDVYAKLVAFPADAVITDFSLAIRETATPLALGKTVWGQLAERDPVFRIAAIAGDTTKEYRTYFDLYRVTFESAGTYEVKVDAEPGNGFFVRSVVVPIFRVLSQAGEVLLAGSPDGQDITIGKAVLQLATPGDYLVFVGADNSDPGSNAGVAISPTFGQPGSVTANNSQPLASNATGRYSVRVKAQKKR